MAGSQYLKGFTFPSFFASLFAMLLMGILIQYGQVMLLLNSPADHPLAIPAMVVFLALLVVSGIFFSLFKFRLLSQAELLCVLFSLLISAPLMSTGFWHKAVSIVASLPRMGYWDKIDAQHDKFWPHGENHLEDILSPPNTNRILARGTVVWNSQTGPDGRAIELPELSNKEPNAVSSIRIKLPLVRNGERAIQVGEPYLISVLAKSSNLGANSFYFCRLFNDEDPIYVKEAFISRDPSVKTFLHPHGFTRIGCYENIISRKAREHMTLEFGLSGSGSLVLADPKFFSVASLEYAYRGRLLASEAEYASLAESDRIGTIVKPANPWSMEGVRFLFSGYIPINDWLETFCAWSSLILILLTAAFSVNVIMRKQWIEHERYSMPLTRIPLAFLGDDEQGETPLSTIWRNPIMWTGFALTLFWCLMRSWNYFNPEVPNLNVEIKLKEHFWDNRWGNAFDATFKLYAIFVAIGLFMELNVLLSLFTGYVLWRSLFWLGAATPLKANPGYPFGAEQMTAAFLTYGILILFFARKYFKKRFRNAFSGPAMSGPENRSFRNACFTLLGMVLMACLWAQWAGFSISGILLFFTFLLLLAMIASKLRAECGLPFGGFAFIEKFNPIPMVLLTLAGGLQAFGGETFLICLMASSIMLPGVFLFIPGAHLEFLELGRKFQVTPRHLIFTSYLAVIGGLVIGGWVFLSNAYAFGGDNGKFAKTIGVTPAWSYCFNQQLTIANNQIAFPEKAAGADKWNLSALGYAYGAVGTLIITVLRQLFAGFWFHPVGFILGPSDMMSKVWGSLIAAWFIRWTVLKFGGAVTVRTKLMPFAIGIFLAAVISGLLYGIIGAVCVANGIEDFYPEIP